MPYLRVVCYICGAVWNYLDEKPDYLHQTTAFDVLGCVCPYCGSLALISGGATNTTVIQSKVVSNG